jgi:ribosomal protein S18 acetylase RimI-like enzyme
MIEITPYSAADLPTIVAFVAAIQEHERRCAPKLKSGAEIGDEYAALLLDLVRTQAGFMLLAKAGGEAIGFVCAWPDRDDDPLLAAAAQAHGYISDLYVVPAWRRRGVARLLMEAAEQALRHRGCRRLQLHCKAGNATALATYAAMGFRPYEITLTRELDE